MRDVREDGPGSQAEFDADCAGQKKEVEEAWLGLDDERRRRFETDMRQGSFFFFFFFPSTRSLSISRFHSISRPLVH